MIAPITTITEQHIIANGIKQQDNALRQIQQTYLIKVVIQIQLDNIDGVVTTIKLELVFNAPLHYSQTEIKNVNAVN